MSSLPILSVEIISEKHIIVGGSGPISTKYNTRDARKETPVTYHFKNHYLNTVNVVLFYLIDPVSW